MPEERVIGGRLVCGDLTLEFVWFGEGFEHVAQHGQNRLRSSQAPGYATPIYQEVHQQGELLFASGHSGHCHWSASFQPSDNGFLADVACRVLKDPTKAIGVAYLGGTGVSVVPDDGSTLTEPDATSLLLTPPTPTTPNGPPPFTVRCRYRIDGGRVR